MTTSASTSESVAIAALRWYTAKKGTRAEQIRAEAALTTAIENHYRQPREQLLPPA